MNITIDSNFNLIESYDLNLINGGGALGTAIMFCGGVACIVWSPIIGVAAGAGYGLILAGSGIVAVVNYFH